MGKVAEQLPSADFVNVAPTLWAERIVTEHAPVPEHAPVQPEKVYPVLGVAVRVTTLLELNGAEQLDPQLMPAGEVVMVPLVGGKAFRLYEGKVPALTPDRFAVSKSYEG